MSTVSPHLVWSCIRENSCFIKKNSGLTFATEPNNLKNTHTFKYNGLIHHKVSSYITRNMLGCYNEDEERGQVEEQSINIYLCRHRVEPWTNLLLARQPPSFIFATRSLSMLFSLYIWLIT